MNASDPVDSASVTRFPLGCWVTVCSGTQQGETVAHRLDDAAAYHVLGRLGEAFEQRGPLPLSRVRTVVRNARRELRAHGPTPTPTALALITEHPFPRPLTTEMGV